MYVLIYIVKSGKYAICNCTPHPIRFQEQDGSIVEVMQSGMTLPATPVEKELTIPVYGTGEVSFVVTFFKRSEQGEQELELISQSEQECCLEIIPVGSIISAQAWPGRVVSLVPVPGFERKPPQEKLYHVDKFNIFSDKA